MRVFVCHQGGERRVPSTDASNRHEDDDHEEDGGQQSWSEFACGTFVRAERFSLTTADCCRRCGVSWDVVQVQRTIFSPCGTLSGAGRAVRRKATPCVRALEWSAPNCSPRVLNRAVFHLQSFSSLTPVKTGLARLQ